MATAAETQLLYITYFGRPADPAGLQFWTTGANAALPLTTVANSFAANPEWASTTVGKNTEQVINSFYVNLFGRQGDGPGVLFWTNKVNSGQISLQQVGLFIAQGALVQPVGSPDRVSIESKQAASDRWTAAVAADPGAINKYNGALANTFGVDFLIPVTTAATIPSVIATALSVATLPPVGTQGILSSSASSVTEGGTVIFTVTTIPELANQELTYSIAGVQAADVLGPLAGTVTVGADGVAKLAVTLATDAIVETGEVLSISFPNVVAKPVGSGSVIIIDTSVVPPAAIQVQAIPAAVNEGSPLTFNISTQNIPTGTVLTYVLSGVNSADVNNAPLTSTVVVNGSGTAVVQFLVSNDLIFGETDTATLTVTSPVPFAATGSASSVINDTTPPPVSTVLLTTGQDILSGTAVPNFTFFGNEATLGQNDQLSRGAALFARFDIGTTGSFVLDNFTATGIQSFDLTPAGESLSDTGEVDLSTATGLSNINVIKSKLGSLKFDDIQDADGFRTIVSDTISNITYNFDANALSGINAVQVIINETPIDGTSGEAVGFDFTQGPTGLDASIETLNLASLAATGVKNVVDRLSVGDALKTLNITGGADLEITTDLNSQTNFLFPGNDNGRISLIDASTLNAALTLTYTSELGDPLSADDNLFDVDVLGAVGSNFLTFGSTATPNPTDYRVKTQASRDTVVTVGGADSIDSGAGDDSVDAGEGNDTVFSISGNNSIVGGLGNDSIVTGIGNDLIFGDAVGKLAGDTFGTGNDTISSGSGNDTIFTASGANFVEAGVGDDIVTVGDVEQNNDKLLGDIAADGFPNTILLGAGNDRLRIDTDSLTVLDTINGGVGLDTIELHNGGTILQSETLRTRQIEAFDLVGPGDYDVTLSDDLVRSSDATNSQGSRQFTVDATEPFLENTVGDVYLDLTFLTPVDAQGNLISIRYFGSNDDDLEIVAIRDGLINDQTVVSNADVLQIVDSADVTKDDLRNFTNVGEFALTSSVNAGQTFTIDLSNITLAQFNAITGGSLIITATELLQGAVSNLILDVTNAPSAVQSAITIEQSANLNVTVIGGTVNIVTALFYTPNIDRLPIGSVVPGIAPFIPDGSTVLAFQLSDVQTSDYVNANEFGADETIEFQFAVSNSLRSLEENLNFTQIYGIDRFVFDPAAINQAVSFDGIDAGGFPEFAEGLDSIFTSGGSDRLVNIERSLYIDTGAGADTIDLTFDAPGTIVSGTGDDSVSGSDFADSVIAGQGDDFVETFAGNDFIDAGTGNNTVFAGEDNDTVTAANGNNFINTSEVVRGIPVNDNDSVLTGLGLDTIYVGLGNDTVRSGGGDDIIGLGVNSADFYSVVESDGLSSGDVIDGGGGFDILGFGIDTTSLIGGGGPITRLQPNAAGQPTISSIEAYSVNYTQSGLTLELGRNNAIQAGGTLSVIISDNNAVVTSSVLDASEFTVTERLIAGVTDLEGSATVIGGAGSDNLFTVGAPESPSTIPFNFGPQVEGNYTYYGLGGADEINLIDGVSTLGGPYREQVGYASANDGGNAGQGDPFGLVSDTITGFRQSRNTVAPFTDIEDRVVISDQLRVALGGTIGNQLTFVFNGFADFNPVGGRVAGLILGNGISDGVLSDTTDIANRINGFGVDSGIPILIPTTTGLVVVQGATQSALYAFVENGLEIDKASANELYKLGTFDNVEYLGGIDTTGNLITTSGVTFTSANFFFGANAPIA